MPREIGDENPFRCPIMRRAKDALKLWNAYRNDNDVTVHDTAGCAGMLAKALKDLIALVEGQHK